MHNKAISLSRFNKTIENSTRMSTITGSHPKIVSINLYLKQLSQAQLSEPMDLKLTAQFKNWVIREISYTNLINELPNLSSL